MTGPDLKPCPFCGGAMPPHDDTGYIRCMGCGAESGWRATPEGAAAAWNTRTPAVLAALPEVQALIAAASAETLTLVLVIVTDIASTLLSVGDDAGANALCVLIKTLEQHNSAIPKSVSEALTPDDATAVLARSEREAEARGLMKGLREAAEIVADVQRQEMSDTEGVMPPDRFDEGTSAAYEAIIARADQIERDGK